MDSKLLVEIASRIESVAPHVDYLVRVAKPSITISVKDAPPTPEGSRFGGRPYAPPGFGWPVHDVGEYRFLGQINFAEIGDAPGLLPDTGLLGLFYAHDEDGEVFWGDDGYVLGYYWEEPVGHELLYSPYDTPRGQQITFTNSLDIPRHSDLRDDWPFDEDDLWELTDAIDPPSEYLLGYPSFTSLAYDPTPGPEWMSLLTVHSLEQFAWNWHDGDKLMVFIERDRLANCDFNHLKSDAG